ncbi:MULTISPECIES: membrane protein [Aliivibrio]|jgi:hypothetical protein|uniref:Uncharacterized protein n=3 Tax=Aliivibrio TaxID=511678 RepID=A0A1B9P0B2_ALILO|nr:MULTISPECIES: membrane protein [Aliivibrio]AZL84810.1 hypothetical protein EIJ81_09480 [Aliivibrio salmonicida]MBB1315542.1 hypothetical protein [Aliivibrio sp. SR45-2]OCH21800.1 hypothetical protein A6E04_08030 [Aliivibrio logei]OEF10769.1 hypothetical protein A1Q5_13085 [Aliivibrio logei 5S-186]CAQ79264.1 membrane protein [Aliivibrio salmonicida LFI1238]
MNEQPKEKTFVLGGSIEKALSGEVELSPVSVIQEAWKNTIKHFFTFSPAILLLTFSYMAIFFLALQIQLGDPAVLFKAILGEVELTSKISYAAFVAGLSAQVIVSPLTAGASLMGMSHAAGIKCPTQYIFKGIASAGMVALVTILSEVFQGMVNLYLPLVALYLSMAFGFAILLVCEKKVMPLKALLLSFRATNKKLGSMLLIHVVIMLALVFGIALYGVGLIVVMPFIFNIKGILYRNMFGITLKVMVKKDDEGNGPDHQVQNNIFNA